MDALDRINAAAPEHRMTLASTLVDAGVDLPTLLIALAELKAEYGRAMSGMRAQLLKLNERADVADARVDEIEPDSARPILLELRKQAKQDSDEIHKMYAEVCQQMVAIQAVHFVFRGQPDQAEAVMRVVKALDFGREWWAKHGAEPITLLMHAIDKEINNNA